MDILKVTPSKCPPLHASMGENASRNMWTIWGPGLATLVLAEAARPLILDVSLHPSIWVVWADKVEGALESRAALTGTNLKVQTPICGFLRVPAVFCSSLQRSAVFCKICVSDWQMLRFLGKSEILHRSAKRLGLSPQVRPLKRAQRKGFQTDVWNVAGQFFFCPLTGKGFMDFLFTCGFLNLQRWGCVDIAAG